MTFWGAMGNFLNISRRKLIVDQWLLGLPLRLPRLKKGNPPEPKTTPRRPTAVGDPAAIEPMSTDVMAHRDRPPVADKVVTRSRV
jgi:hypothetical protein